MTVYGIWRDLALVVVGIYNEDLGAYLGPGTVPRPGVTL